MAGGRSDKLVGNGSKGFFINRLFIQIGKNRIIHYFSFTTHSVKPENMRFIEFTGTAGNFLKGRFLATGRHGKENKVFRVF